jgi:hypothetical protein
MEGWLGSETSPAAVTNGKTPTLEGAPHTGTGIGERVGTATIDRKGASPASPLSSTQHEESTVIGDSDFGCLRGVYAYQRPIIRLRPCLSRIAVNQVALWWSGWRIVVLPIFP